MLANFKGEDYKETLKKYMELKEETVVPDIDEVEND